MSNESSRSGASQLGCGCAGGPGCFCLIGSVAGFGRTRAVLCVRWRSFGGEVSSTGSFRDSISNEKPAAYTSTPTLACSTPSNHSKQRSFSFLNTEKPRVRCWNSHSCSSLFRHPYSYTPTDPAVFTLS